MAKKRSKLGRWLDDRKIKQEILIEYGKISRGTASSLCSGKRKPTTPTLEKVMKALRKIDKKVKVEDVFDI